MTNPVTIYRGHVAGFNARFRSLTSLRNWAVGLRNNHGCKGHTLKVMQGTRHGTVETFEPNCPTKEIVL